MIRGAWHRRFLGFGLACWAMGLAAWGQLVGGGFRLTAQVVGGGGTSVGGTYVLRGAASHSAAGRSVSVVEPGTIPPDFQVIGGWLGPVTGAVVPRPSMRVRFTDDKLAELSWDIDISGYILEFSSSIGPDANWQPVSPQPIGMSFTTPCAQPARYFRLRSP